MKPITVAEFAKIKGVSPTAVHKAIASGRLKNCLVRDPKYKKPRIDPVVAAQEWERNTDHNKRHTGNDLRPAPERAQPFSKAPENPGGQVSPTSKQILDNYRARLAKLDFEERTGILVNADKVKAEWFKLVTEAKTKLLALPSKAKSNLPHLEAADIAALEIMVREALEDLSNGSS